jgi:hypothetical protein
MSLFEVDQRLQTAEAQILALKTIIQLTNRATSDGTELVAVSLPSGDEYKMNAETFFKNRFKSEAADYTLLSSDKNSVIEMAGAAATITIPDSLGWENGSRCYLMQANTGLTFAYGTTVNTNKRIPQALTDVQYSIYEITKTATDTFTIVQIGTATGGGGGGDALTSNPLSQFAATTSAQLAGVLSDETGTGLAVFNNSPALITPDLGTPSALVGTNITGIPNGALTTNPLARANHTGTQAASTISDFAATVRAVVLTGLSLATATAITAADTILVAIGKLQAQITALPSLTQTLTNKRITMRVQSVVSSATVTPNADNDDVVKITAQAVGLTLSNPSGTPTDMQPITIRIKDNATARAITYGAQYRAIGITLPTTTTISKTTYLGMIWNSDDSKWDVVGTNTEA